MSAEANKTLRLMNMKRDRISDLYHQIYTCLKHIMETRAVLQIRKGNSHIFEAIIICVSSSNRIKIRRTDTLKEYWIHPYFIIGSPE